MTELKSSVTHVDGVEVIAREPALGPHPQHGQEVTWAGVTKVLLADGTERYVCDVGDYSADTVRSVVSHRNGTHQRTSRRDTQYPDATIREVIRQVKIAKRDGRRDFVTRAADALNEAQVPTIRGEPWTSTNVSHLYARFERKFRVSISKRPRATSEAMLAVTEQVAAMGTRAGPPKRIHPVLGRYEDEDDAVATQTPSPEPSDVLRIIARIIDNLRDTQVMICEVQRRLDDMQDPDPELEEKARKYDEIRERLQ